ncbi:superoxide dismutase family protein [Pseudotabrizicola formosa]|uniref:superoxide dismutase family protein n=1 Tax=Pseudotabrizicola formosa TaxID=2030009 RepID=UPI000CCFDFF5|nr:superoxide dismutase family protein [Pseudotabrizicola formosa]
MHRLFAPKSIPYEFIVLCLGLAALASAPLAAQHNTTAEFIDNMGQPAGSAILSAAPNGVLIEVEVSGLPPESWVAFHIHETGSCDPATGHDSAGEHFNPSQTEHGYFAELGPHAGDMPNLWVDASGVAKAQVFNPFIVLTEGDNLARGRALMVHAQPDDYRTQPSGDAGERLACAVIE